MYCHLTRLLAIIALTLNFSCNNDNQPPAFGGFEKLDDEFEQVVSPGATIEIIADSLDWCEGPLWLESQQALIFSDIPLNRIYKWTSTGGVELYLEPAGYTNSKPRGGETGSNGLTLDPDGNLVLCQHGDRRIARMDAPLDRPAPEFTTIADNYKGLKFDSPNDLVFDKKGRAYFTDPPYGLEKNVDDSSKQAQYQGVYRILNGEVQLLLDSISRPNGIALTPDNSSIIIANSDPAKPYWYAYDIAENDSLINGRIFFDASTAPFKEKGVPDGFKINRDGYVFASGPGGIWVFNKNARLLGRIAIPQAVSNCAFADEGKTLFVTADDKVLKVKLR